MAIPTRILFDKLGKPCNIENWDPMNQSLYLFRFFIKGSDNPQSHVCQFLVVEDRTTELPDANKEGVQVLAQTEEILDALDKIFYAVPYTGRAANPGQLEILANQDRLYFHLLGKIGG